MGGGKGAGARRCDGDTKLKVSVQRTHTHISTWVSSQITAVPGQARGGSAHCKSLRGLGSCTGKYNQGKPWGQLRIVNSLS